MKRREGKRGGVRQTDKKKDGGGGVARPMCLPVQSS